ncbi:hypothetical protein N8H74_06265 [Pseudomonas sp. B2M1-30]|uniref:hypothetical protein n=1 Tax=Pseudomonas TaxID=286 RepID=UPI0021C73E54|nr:MULTISPECIES: hypothetical protein [Pseudomonas]MCU0117848.1 hypothetical protein [Pseudomonas sp. B2M1-30]MCU7259384.1 hypothetical protein [Pseudomonas koreensis]
MPAALWLVVLLIFSTCAVSGEDDNLDMWSAQNLAEPKIQFLGVGGWLIHWRGEGLLLAPSFSNPASFIPDFPPILVKADKRRIDTYMRTRPVDDVTLLLVGHGHYDHLLDVPWVMRKYAPKAVVYGSDTVVHILHSMKDPARTETEDWTWVDPDRVKSARGYMATVPGCDGAPGPAKPGYWITSTGGAIRAMPIQSMHAPHILGYTVGHGSYTEDLTEVPTSVFGWKQGQSMAWLIDLLDVKGKPEYRIHFQDSAAPAPCGIPPAWPDQTPIDVEILSVGSWTKADQYPEQLLKATKPRVVLLGHWENFFGNDPYNPEPLTGNHVARMMEKVKAVVSEQKTAATVYLPKPFAEIPLPPTLNGPSSNELHRSAP